MEIREKMKTLTFGDVTYEIVDEQARKNIQAAIKNYESEGKDSFATNDSSVASGEGAFAAGIDNLAMGNGSVVFGLENIAGSKGYYISALDFESREIYLSETQVTDAPPVSKGTIDEDFETPAYEIGDEFNIIVPNDHYILCGTIDSIENNVVTYTEDSELGFAEFMSFEELQERFSTTEWSEICAIDDYTFSVPRKPEIGIVLVGGYEFTTGAYNKVSGSFAHVEGAGNLASGNFSHAEGQSTIAGYSSHAEGLGTTALGKVSHAEGNLSVAIGKHSHAECNGTIAKGNFSHAEGNTTQAIGTSSHAEGYNTQSVGISSHAEGDSTTAEGEYSHTEGKNTKTTEGAKGAHAEGGDTIASAVYAHAEGYNTKAIGKYSHTEGNNTATVYTDDGEGVKYQGQSAHAEGQNTIACGNYSHAEGYGTLSKANFSHTEGQKTKALGASSHAEGNNTEAVGTESHAEGCNTIASGSKSHAEGYNNTVSAPYAHVEGQDNTITRTAKAAHAEGYRNTVGYNMTTGTDSGMYSHAEGQDNAVYGTHSHVEGRNNYTSGKYAHVEGYGNENYADYVHVQGRYCGTYGEGDDKKYIHVVGWGNQQEGTKNIHLLDWHGSAWYAGSVKSNGADYAEFFEWQDGNPNNEDRVGLLVTLDGEKIRPANISDEILGVISGTVAVLGDTYESFWQGRYLTDDFGRIQYEDVEEFHEVIVGEDEGGNPIIEKQSLGFFKHPVLNPAYNPTQKYVNRSNRPEWDTVGMLGKLYVRDDGTCQVNGYATVGVNGIATTSSVKTNIRVLSRINDNIIRVLLK